MLHSINDKHALNTQRDNNDNTMHWPLEMPASNLYSTVFAPFNIVKAPSKKKSGCTLKNKLSDPGTQILELPYASVDGIMS